MIEKMRSVCVAARASRKDELLLSLRDLGMLHLAVKRAADPELTERFDALSRLSQELKEYEVKGRRGRELSDAEFDETYRAATAALAEKTSNNARLAELLLEKERIKDWGDFDPREVRALSDVVELHFFRMDKREYRALLAREDLSFIRLRPVDKQEAVALVGKPDDALSATEFRLPEKSLSELENEERELHARTAACDETLADSAACLKSYAARLLEMRNEVEYSAADASLESSDGIVWLSGYIPASQTDRFTAAASEHAWAWMMQDADESDAGVPTEIRYNKVTALIKPLFDVLGVVPGYGEYDISFWFLAFFALFFAMIIGDAGYGTLFLIGTIVFHARTKKIMNVTLLMYLLSATTIIWGALTGTWFGLEAAMDVPFLKALVIPGFANYPEYFDVTASQAQNNVMRFCFTIGVIQLALACVMNIRRRIARRSLAWVADLGWLLAVCALYFMVLYLVIGVAVNIPVVAAVIGAGFLLVVLFGGMSPDKSFSQGLKAGLADTFTTFLNTISAFGNVMSYIRLFAVGMASLAIAQSFNDMASGFGGPLVVVGIAIMIVGHALNIVMGFLSVVVHGVRLNLLEFSGQLGMEWSGIAYDPFRVLKNERDKRK